MTASALLAALLLLALTTQPGRVSGADYADIAGALNASSFIATWAAANADVFSGFCLDSADGDVALLVNASLQPLRSRALQDWYTPLYTRPIRLFAIDDSPIAYAWVWLVKLLVQEVLGYQVYTRDLANDPYALAVDGLLDADPVHYSQASNPGEWLPAQHTEVNLPGLHVPQRTLDENPELLLNFWRSFDARSTPASVWNASLQLFIEDSWAGLIGQQGESMLNFSSGDLVCAPDFVQALEGLPPQGCVGGIYTPPQCQANPRADCAVIYHSQPVYDGLILQGGTLPAFVRTMQLPFVVAYINPVLKEQHLAWLNSQGRHFLFWALNLEGEEHELCPSTSSGFCYARVQLPTFSADCLAQVTLGLDSNYSCDYEAHPILVMADPALHVTAPRAWDLLSRFIMAPDDTAELYRLLRLQVAASPAQADRPDYKRLACSYITNHTERWLPWISPPAQCSTADLVYSQSACDVEHSVITISYSWAQPKACQEGIQLPSPDTVACEERTLAMSREVAALVFTLLLLAFTAALLVLLLLTPIARRRSVAQVTAAIQKRQLQPRSSTSAPPESVGLWMRLTAFQSSLPIHHLLSPPLVVLLLVGSVFLLATNFALLGQVSEPLCQHRLALLVTGVSAWQAVLFVGALLALQLPDKARVLSLQTHLSRRLAVAAWLWWLAEMLLYTLSGVLGSPLLAKEVWQLPGGGGYLNSYCSSPASWYVSALIGSDGGLAVASLALLLRTNLRLWGQRRSSAQKDDRGLRRKQVQASSLLLCQLLVLAAEVVVPGQWADKSTDGHTIALQVRVLHAMTLSVVALLPLLLYGPSLYHHYHSQRRVTARGSQVTSVNGGVQLLLGGTGDSTTSAGSEGESRSGTKHRMAADSLAATLCDPLAVVLFRGYCEDVHDAEPVHFLLAVRELLRAMADRNSHLTLQQLQARCKDVVDAFLLPSSREQVNVSSHMRLTVEKALGELSLKSAALAGRMKTGTATPATDELKALVRSAFEPVVKEVFSVLEVNTFARFLRSETAVRASELLSWSDDFRQLQGAEQVGALERMAALAGDSFKPHRLPRMETRPAAQSVISVGSRARLSAVEGEPALLSPTAASELPILTSPLRRSTSGSAAESSKAAWGAT